MSEYEGLTDEQVAAERELLSGLAPINIGALFLPPVWGPGHGQWWTILWYPVWLLADNLFYAAYAQQTPLSIGLSVVAFAILLVFTLVYARLAQPYGLHRAIDKFGKSKKEYARAERRWAVGCVIGGCAALALATYYNLTIRPTIG